GKGKGDGRSGDETAERTTRSADRAREGNGRDRIGAREGGSGDGDCAREGAKRNANRNFQDRAGRAGNTAAEPNAQPDRRGSSNAGAASEHAARAQQAAQSYHSS